MSQRIRKVLCFAIIFVAIYSMREFINALYNLRPSQIHVYPMVGESYLIYLTNVLHRKGFWVAIYGLVLLVYCLALSLCEILMGVEEESSANELTLRLVIIMFLQLVITVASGIGIMRFPLLITIILAYVIAEILYTKKHFNLYGSVVSKQHCIIVILVYFVLNNILIHDSWLIAILMTVSGIAVIMFWRGLYVVSRRAYE